MFRPSTCPENRDRYNANVCTTLRQESMATSVPVRLEPCWAKGLSYKPIVYSNKRILYTCIFSTSVPARRVELVQARVRD